MDAEQLKGHRLIAAYRDDLLASLPSQLADEVSDGLADAQQKYLGRGLRPDQAAQAAIAEFGSPGVVAEAFRRACPAWSLARVLVVTGPAVGGWWAAALIAGHAWDWPIPVAVPLTVGLILAVSVVLLLTAARTHRYQWLRLTGLAGCLGLVVLDVTVTTAALLSAPTIRWLLVLAVCASTARLTYVFWHMRQLAPGPGS